MSIGIRLRLGESRKGPVAVARYLFAESTIARWTKRRLYKTNEGAIVVLGNQKSGTSAIAHLLADRCGLSKTVDIPQLWPPTFEKIESGRLSLAALVADDPKPFSRRVIKEPYLTFLYPEIREVFPFGRFIFVVRDPRDNIRSILNRFGIFGDLNRADVSKWRIPSTWKGVLDTDRLPPTVRAHIEALAQRWNRAAQVYLENASDLVLVTYEDFLDDKIAAIDRLARCVNEEPKANISNRVDRPFQPAGERSVHWPSFFGTHLHRINQICRLPMLALGYSPEQIEPYHSYSRRSAARKENQ